MDALGKGIADLDCLDPLGEAGKELVVDSRLHKDAGTSAAGLTVVPALKENAQSQRRQYDGRLTKHHALPNRRPGRGLRH